MAIKKLPHFAVTMLFLCSLTIVAQPIVTDPLPYAPIANPLPDTMSQKMRDSVNMKFSPIRLNQAGYRPQDKKFFYYVGSSASTFSVINTAGASVGTGSLTPTGKTNSSKLNIWASNDASIISGGDTSYLMNSATFSGSIYEGVIPDLPPGAYQVVVGTEKSHPFIIDERVYSWVKDALLKFYGVNRCGDSQSWFHDACHVKDAVTGGWHDCGDHLKEGATMSYTAAVLGLAAAVFADRDVDVYSANQGITQVTDGIPDILYEAKHGADFVLQSYDKAAGNVSKMVTSMGGFGNPGCGDDHSWWGRPDEQDYMPAARGGPPRCARSEPTSDYLGKYAANLAFVSKKIRPYNAVYADKCLAVAKAIYAFTLPKLDKTNTSAYNGSTIVTDDVGFAALALLWATGERKYLDDLCYDKTIGIKASPTFNNLFEGGLFTNNDPLFTKTTANTDWASNQTHVLWGFFRLILEDETLCEDLNITPKERLSLIGKTMANLMANLSSVGLGDQSIPLPAGVLWVPSMVKYELPWFTMHTQMEWVWNRYQAGNITDMYYYYDMATRINGMDIPNYLPDTTNWKINEIKTVMVRMLDYMLGVNPWDISMVYGVGEKNYNHPHHRAANPEGKNVPGAFYDYRPPVGALQGGAKPKPQGVADLYVEHYDWYQTAETGIDGTTNLLMPVLGLAKIDTIGPPTGTVQIVYKGCDEAIVEVRQSRYGTAVIRYGSGAAPDKILASDSAGVFHRFVLKGLTQGTTYNFDVLITDLFDRQSVVKYIDEDKNAVFFTFTTLQNCPTNAQIENVKVCKVTADSAEIFWYTPNGAFDSRVVYGEQKPPATVHEGDVADHPVKFHYVKIGNLKEKTTYYFYVESGDSRDDNKGELYTFTTPVEHVEFDVRTLRYTWSGKPAVGINIVNQDSKAYDSLEIRLYFRAKEGFENDLGARIDIMVLYRADGFQDTISGELRRIIWANLATQKPQKMLDTYDAADGTYAYYFAIPLWGVEMRSLSRIRMDVVFVRWEPDRHQDLLDEPPLHQITDRDWSFGPHSKANGEPMDFPGVPILPKEQVDRSYAKQPINYYVTVYRKNEYVWGYSPSQEELKTKKTHYSMESMVTSPLVNPSATYVFYESPNARSVNVSGWATVTPTDGTLNDIWINGVKQTTINSLFTWNSALGRYDFTIPVPVQNGSNNVDITLFSGPPATCDECYGCAVSNHSFNIDFRGAKLYPSTLVLRDAADLPLSDTVKVDTTVFHVIVTDRNGNVNGKAVDNVSVTIKNPDNNDSVRLILVETGDSTGIFRTTVPVGVFDRTPDATTGNQIAMNGGDRARIWYVDANDSLDMSEAFIYSKASFPQARSGYLKDQNGDGTVDLLVVQYSMALKALPDSLRIFFPSAAASYLFPSAAGGMTMAGAQLQAIPSQVMVNGVTGFSSATYSTGRSYLLNAGLVKMSEFKVYDSIGPVLNGLAVVKEREPGIGLDTITVTLSEGYRIADLKGTVLLVRRAGVDYPLDVITLLDVVQGTYTVTLLVDAKGVGVTAGDSLWLNPASPYTDMSGNKPHVNNRRVPIVVKAALPSVTSAYYQDSNFDGVLDRVVIGFSKPLAADLLSLNLRWNTAPQVPVAPAAISVLSPAEISIALLPEFTGNKIETGGAMSCAAVFGMSLTDTIIGIVADSAAPVLRSGKFYLSSSQVPQGYLDTLEVVFSESVRFADSLTMFNLSSTTTGVQYTFTKYGYLGTVGDVARYTGIITGVEFPRTGDKVWLPGNSGVADMRNNSQTSPLNRHAPVEVAEVKLSLKDVSIKKAPNPFCPPLGEIFRVKITPLSRFPMQLDSSAQAVIYDKVGNVVNKAISLKMDNGVELQWNGTNKKGRFVGIGTYLMILSFKGDQEKILVGVVGGK